MYTNFVKYLDDPLGYVKRIKRLEKDFESIKEELSKLESFRDTILLRKFKRQLQGELSNIKEKFNKLTETREQKEAGLQKKRNEANRNRSVKNKRVWNFMKSIQRNWYPDKPIKEIRTSWKKHRKGLENDISDIAWKNPSP